MENQESAAGTEEEPSTGTVRKVVFRGMIQDGRSVVLNEDISNEEDTEMSIPSEENYDEEL